VVLWAREIHRARKRLAVRNVLRPTRPVSRLWSETSTVVVPSPRRIRRCLPCRTEQPGTTALDDDIRFPGALPQLSGERLERFGGGLLESTCVREDTSLTRSSPAVILDRRFGHRADPAHQAWPVSSAVSATYEAPRHCSPQRPSGMLTVHAPSIAADREPDPLPTSRREGGSCPAPDFVGDRMEPGTVCTCPGLRREVDQIPHE